MIKKRRKPKRIQKLTDMKNSIKEILEYEVNIKKK